jgi:hypothetical protein
MNLLSWTQWQEAVLAQLRIDFRELFREIGPDDVDWQAWRPLYLEGRAPRAAVLRAYERDL